MTTFKLTNCKAGNYKRILFYFINRTIIRLLRGIIEMNKSIDIIEDFIEKSLSKLPHLPERFKKWLSTNFWIIILVGLLLSCLAVIFMIVYLIQNISMIGAYPRFVYGLYSVNLSYHSGWNIFTDIISIIFMTGTIILISLSIKPLMNSQKKGWKLLFYALLLQAVAIIINAILSLNILSLIYGLIGFAIGSYLLFEVKSYFVKK